MPLIQIQLFEGRSTEVKREALQPGTKFYRVLRAIRCRPLNRTRYVCGIYRQRGQN